MSLEVTVTQKVNGLYIISPVGSIDGDNYMIFKNQVDKVLFQQPKALVLDFAGLDFICSAALGVIFQVRFALEKSGEFAIANLKPQIKAVFDVVKALPEQNVFTSVAEMDHYLARIQRRIIEGQG